MSIPAHTCRDLRRATALEWLEVNGRGGFSSGTVSGVATRRYHGLLLVASSPPHQRTMLVNHLEERLETPAGPRWLSTSVSTSALGDPGGEDGYQRCRGFAPLPAPEWTYDLDPDVPGVTIVRSIVCRRGHDTVIVRWQLRGGDGRSFRLLVRPMLTARRAHDVVSAGDPIATEARIEGEGGQGAVVSWQPRASFPRVYAVGGDRYEHAPRWRRGVEYPVDRERGEPWREDWWSPGGFTVELSARAPAYLALSTERPAGEDLAAIFAAELDRRPGRDRAGGSLHDALVDAAESYIVEVDGRAALLAGFPWFDVWTRDTFTAFGGLLLGTGRLELAERTLKTFAPLAEGGLLPNNLPDASTPPNWASVDASLWFIVSVGRYAQAAQASADVLAGVWPCVRAIIDGYVAGIRQVPIKVDDDGLVYESDPKAPLTWMDAQCHGQVMTPRRGKPVEVQALWIQALDVGMKLGRRLGHGAEVSRFHELHARATTSFRARFWNEAGGYLYDVVDGPEGDDATFAPNQLFALSFDAPLVDQQRGRRVLELVRRKLLTPRGLRTLAEDDARYHARYVGPRTARDPAYHQGTVWPFLLAPFVIGWLRFHGATPEARREASSFLDGIAEHLNGEGCLGHISEIFDGSAPHAPRGCFAQAWSLGELLLALKTIEGRGF